MAAALKYTVFTVSASGDHPTTHITSHTATDIEQAKRLAIKETADDWDCKKSDVHVLGVAAGDIEILEWTDEI